MHVSLLTWLYTHRENITIQRCHLSNLNHKGIINGYTQYAQIVFKGTVAKLCSISLRVVYTDLTFIKSKLSCG